jgi:hypothetical protein
MARRSILVLILAISGILGACTSPSTGGAATNAPAPGSAAPAPASVAPTKGGY